MGANSVITVMVRDSWRIARWQHCACLRLSGSQDGSTVHACACQAVERVDEDESEDDQPPPRQDDVAMSVISSDT